jgi:enoyl-CoA hydratase
MRKAMEMMVTGDAITGIEAVELGWANASAPLEDLEDLVLEVAGRIAAMPSDVVQLNKRAVHRQMEYMGLRAGLRAGTEICALGVHTASMAEFLSEVAESGLTAALQQRDEPFDDYRTGG